MRTCLFIFLSLAVVIGCKSRNKIPGDIISPEKMQWVIWDMLRADELAGTYLSVKDSFFNKKATSTELYEKIFLVHQISRERFNESLSYYRTHPALLQTMMDSLYARTGPKGIDSVKHTSPRDTSIRKIETIPMGVDTIKQVPARRKKGSRKLEILPIH